jgi:serine protease AprX
LEIAPSVAYEKAVFPMPKCLCVEEDTIKANVLMTLVHEPDLDASFGSEYCRSNIEVSLGTYDTGEDGKQHQQKQIPEDPKLTGSAYEKDLVEHGFKCRESRDRHGVSPFQLNTGAAKPQLSRSGRRSSSPWPTL